MTEALHTISGSTGGRVKGGCELGEVDTGGSSPRRSSRDAELPNQQIPGGMNAEAEEQESLQHQASCSVHPLTCGEETLVHHGQTQGGGGPLPL